MGYNYDFIWPILIFILAIMLIGGIIYYVYKLEKERTAAIQELAHGMKLEFTAKAKDKLQNLSEGFNLLKQGHSKEWYNLMEGEVYGVKVKIFDFNYTVGGGKSKATYRQTSILLDDPNMKLPDFLLKPEGFFDKISAAFGRQDIDFESHPLFSKKYLLQGKDEKQVRDFFSRKILDFFTEKLGFSIEGENNYLLAYKLNKRSKPEEIQNFIQEVFEIKSVLEPRA